MDKTLLAEFASPPNAYRGKPLWAWNGKLDASELCRQIRIMHHMGFGGFLMQSRTGLRTEYLGDDWFESIKACIDQAAKLDMQAWLCDEDRSPSGAAAGIVTWNPKCRMRQLELTQLAEPATFKWNDEVLAVFSARIDAHSASNVKRLTRQSLRRKSRKPHPGESLLVFRLAIQPPSPRFNGFAYLDTLNPDAVLLFLKITHDRYRRRLGEHFGHTIPGIYTDQPNYGSHDRHSRPWTDKLPAIFRERFGYDLLDHLPELFFNIDHRDISRVRWHFFDCATRLFVTSFSQQIGHWCIRSRLQFAGRLPAQNSLRDQTRSVGSCIRHYEHMQAPGLEISLDQHRSYTAAKQVTSLARQLGLTWRLADAASCAEHDLPLREQKTRADWQLACGITLLTPRLGGSTLLGLAKRDCPVTLSCSAPSSEHHRTLQDYFARIAFLMTRGTEVRDLLVIHPIESMWAMAHRDLMDDPALADYDQAFSTLAATLLQAQIDFDYGDEQILANHARILKTDDPPTFRVAQASYKAILVPPLKTLRSTTLALLKQFAAAGGSVFFADDPPSCVDAEPSPAAAQLAATCIRISTAPPHLVDALAPIARRIKLTDTAGRSVSSILHQLREDKDHLYLFLANTDTPDFSNQDKIPRHPAPAPDELLIQGFADCAAHPIELDPATGRAYAANATRHPDNWTIRTPLPPAASRLFLIPKRRSTNRIPPRPILRDLWIEPLAGDPWPITLSEPNLLVFDRARFKIGHGNWQGPSHILHIDHAVRQTLTLPPRTPHMVQPWARQPSEKLKRTTVTLAYEFQVQAIPSGELCLALEQPRHFTITLNAQPISSDAECGWWMDKSLQRLSTDPMLLKLGNNHLVLECDYDGDFSGLEAIYLLGNFGVCLNGTQLALLPPITSLHLGNWVNQGLPFYGGSVTYRRRITPTLAPGQRLFLRLGQYQAVAVRVLIDSRPAGIIAWEPLELDLTDFLTASSVELALEVLGHRRNSLGPDQPTPQDHPSPEPHPLLPSGLLTAPQLILRQ